MFISEEELKSIELYWLSIRWFHDVVRYVDISGYIDIYSNIYRYTAVTQRILLRRNVNRLKYVGFRSVGFTILSVMSTFRDISLYVYIYISIHTCRYTA